MRYQKTATKNVCGTFIRLGQTPAALYQHKTQKKPVGVLVMHSDSDYLSFSVGLELAERGYTVLCANANPSELLSNKLLAVKECVKYLRALPQVEKVVLFGHSGGATLMSAYQNAAENGGKNFRGDNMVFKLSDSVSGLPPADGIMLIDPNWGNGAMVLFSLDPAVTEEGNPRLRDPELDLFAPANGFDPEGSHYSEGFIRKFLKAQRERNERLIDQAWDRLRLIEAGKGLYEDDEPFLVVGGAGNFMNNKLYAQDPRLMSRTRGEYLLLHGDGRRTKEIIHTMRGPENRRCLTANYRDGLLLTTVRTFLDSHSVHAGEDYYYNEDTIFGVDWTGSYCCTTGNVTGVTVPFLAMGMTKGWEFASVEGIVERAASEDKTVAFVEGATHMYCPDQGDKRFGDTVKTTYDFIAEWLENRFC